MTQTPTCDRLYLVTRRDLPPGQQAVQAAHALVEFGQTFPDENRRWHQTSNTLVFLAVETEKHLTDLLQKARWKGISAAPFREPDRGNELTAVALGPRGKVLTRQLPMALPAD